MVSGSLRNPAMSWNCSSRWGWETGESAWRLTRREKRRERSRRARRPRRGRKTGSRCCGDTSDGHGPGRRPGRCRAAASAARGFRAFFIKPLATATGAAHATGQRVAGGQLAAAARDGGGIETQQGCRAPVAAVPAAQRLEAREPASLALVERADERALAGPFGGVGGRVPEAPVAQFAGDLPAGDEFAECVAGADLQQGVEFLDAVAGGGLCDQGSDGEEEVAAGGEAHLVEGPQAVGVELRAVGKDVEAAGVGVAGVMREVAQLAHGSPLRIGAQGSHQLRQHGDGLAAQQIDEGVGGVLGRSHGVVVTMQ